jgi:antibiotic biosynthesis monooxygenase (ABM) superfamily enzyme
MSLPEHLLVVDVSVDPDVEADWNDWYDKIHLPEIVSCPGFRLAARYISEVDGERRYLTIYEIEGPEAFQTMEFAQRRGWGRFKEKVSAYVRTYRQVTVLEAE